MLFTFIMFCSMSVAVAAAVLSSLVDVVKFAC